MRVLLINVNCRHGSTGEIVYDLYAEINRRGHTAAICYGRGPTIVEPNKNEFSSNVEVYPHALLTRLTGPTGCYSYSATHNPLRLMDEFHAYFVNLDRVVTRYGL